MEATMSGKKLFWTLVIGGSMAASVYGILMYKTPYVSDLDMSDAQKQLKAAIWHHEQAYTKALEQSYDSLNNNTQYKQILNELNIVWKNVDDGQGEYCDSLKKIEQLEDAADSIGNKLLIEQLNKNDALKAAQNRLEHAQNNLEQKQSDSAKMDSINKIPLIKRFKNNIVKIRKDYFCNNR